MTLDRGVPTRHLSAVLELLAAESGHRAVLFVEEGASGNATQTESQGQQFAATRQVTPPHSHGLCLVGLHVNAHLRRAPRAYVHLPAARLYASQHMRPGHHQQLKHSHDAFAVALDPKETASLLEKKTCPIPCGA